MKSMPHKSKNEFVILSCKDYPQGNSALQGLCAHLKAFWAKRGVECEAKIAPWRELDLKNLSSNSVLLPLAVWDYSQHYDEFLRFLDKIKRLNLAVFNPLPLLRWNLSKLYLKELENLGFDIVPSLFVRPSQNSIDEALKRAKMWQNPIIKPLVSQSGNGVFRLDGLNLNSLFKDKLFKNGFVLQEFMSEILDKGELCLVFFNAKFHYAITRKVACGEFRANSQFGASIHSCEVVEKSCLDTARQILAHLPQKPLYARIDFITHKGKALINEVELIEPSLYFDYDKCALQNFCEAVFASLKHRI